MVEHHGVQWTTKDHQQAEKQRSFQPRGTRHASAYAFKNFKHTPTDFGKC